jgi:fimbrial chaperone protein
MMRKTLIFGVLWLLGPWMAWAQVQIFPTRLTLTDQNISGYLNLQNSSSDPQVYELQLVLFKMRNDGSFDRQKEIPSSHPLVDRLKFSPSQVTLKPGEKQIVRVMVSEFANLPTGEAYLHLQAVPQKASGAKSQAKTNFQLSARIAVAVPIVVRKGAVQAQPLILQARYKPEPDGGLKLSFEIQKKGDGLIFGDLEVLRKQNQTEEIITKVKGIASYIDQRSFVTIIPAEEAKKGSGLQDGELIYRFTSNSESAQSFALEGPLTRDVEKETKGDRKRRPKSS